MVAFGELVVGSGVEGRVGYRVEQQLELNVRFPTLSGQQRNCCCHVSSDAVASHGKALRVHPKLPPMLGDPFHHRVALLDGRRVFGFRGETVLREHDRSLGSDREFAHQPVMRLLAAEHPPGTVDVHDDGQRRRGMLWPHDAQSDLAAWAVVNREILNVDRQLAHLARLRLLEGNPSPFGTKGEQKRWLRHSLRERLRLGF